MYLSHMSKKWDTECPNCDMGMVGTPSAFISASPVVGEES